MNQLNILMIDNKDSFTFNLVDEFSRRGAKVDVWRNTASVGQIEQALAKMEGPKMLMISPGPGKPKEAGCCLDLVNKLKGTLPIFGVCLGHQIIIKVLGGSIIKPRKLSMVSDHRSIIMDVQFLPEWRIHCRWQDIIRWLVVIFHKNSILLLIYKICRWR